MKRIAIVSAAITLVSLCACAAPTSETAPSDQGEGATAAEPGNSAEDVGRTSEALGLQRVFATAAIHYGGTFLEEDHFQNVGGACSTGYVRVDPATVTWAGNGSCNFAGWLNPSNPHDCTARIRTHYSAGFVYGDCSVTIFEERQPGSCHDRTHSFCGGIGSDRSCFCDTSCELYGDCCADYTQDCR